jgi:hypothetical protein
MNFFSSDEFLDVVAQVLYPDRPYTVGICRVKDKHIRTLILKNPVKIVTNVPFLDFFEPIELAADDGDDGSRRVSQSADTAPKTAATAPLSTGLVTSDQWQREQSEGHASEQRLPAPQTRWRGFESFEAYRAYVKRKSPFPFNVSKRKQKKLGREIGEVSFCFHDPAPDVLEQCIRWKSAQYLRTGLWDLFASRRHVELFTEFNRRGILTTTTLRAGAQLLGVHVGMIHDDRFYSWLPSYDPAFEKYSPGTLLFDYMLEQSFQRGHQVFDFLIGGESYKWNYATHAHVVEHYGDPPLAKRLYQPVRDAIVERLRGDNPFYKALQLLKRRYTEFRYRQH